MKDIKKGLSRLDINIKLILYFFIILMFSTCLIGKTSIAASQKKEVGKMNFELISPAFPPNGEIPVIYTCDGKDISPPLEWKGVPPGTKSLVLIVEDPDAPDPAAPRMVWTHWVLYDIPPTAHGLPEGVTPDELPKGTKQGLNDWKRTGYGGPCPPIGRHRYFFRLFALDTVLPDLGTPTKAKLEQAMKGHVIARAVLMGTYERIR